MTRYAGGGQGDNLAGMRELVRLRRDEADRMLSESGVAVTDGGAVLVVSRDGVEVLRAEPGSWQRVALTDIRAKLLDMFRVFESVSDFCELFYAGKLALFVCEGGVDVGRPGVPISPWMMGQIPDDDDV